MQANAYSKYALRDLHEAISLIDRKINHYSHFASFASPEDRECILKKLSHKRAALAKAVIVLTGLGVSYALRPPSPAIIHLVKSRRKSLASDEEESVNVPRRKRP